MKKEIEEQNRAAERLANELERPGGAQKFGDEAYELVKSELDNIIPSSGQIRMARAYLKWSASKLAEQSGVALSTVKRVEQEDSHSSTRVSNIASIRDALVGTGKIRFQGDNCIYIIK